jgi:hypothetical protein
VPSWLAEVVRPRRAPVPWPEMARAALAICVPLSAAFAVGRPSLGVLPATGGLLSALGDIGSVTGLQLLVYTSLGAGPIGALRPVWHTAAGFLAGVVWALILILPGWLRTPYGRCPVPGIAPGRPPAVNRPPGGSAGSSRCG